MSHGVLGPLQSSNVGQMLAQTPDAKLPRRRHSEGSPNPLLQLGVAGDDSDGESSAFSSPLVSEDALPLCNVLESVVEVRHSLTQASQAHHCDRCL